MAGVDSMVPGCNLLNKLDLTVSEYKILAHWSKEHFERQLEFKNFRGKNYNVKIKNYVVQDQVCIKSPASRNCKGFKASLNLSTHTTLGYFQNKYLWSHIKHTLIIVFLISLTTRIVIIIIFSCSSVIIVIVLLSIPRSGIPAFVPLSTWKKYQHIFNMKKLWLQCLLTARQSYTET